MSITEKWTGLYEGDERCLGIGELYLESETWDEFLMKCEIRYGGLGWFERFRLWMWMRRWTVTKAYTFSGSGLWVVLVVGCISFWESVSPWFKTFVFLFPLFETVLWFFLSGVNDVTYVRYRLSWNRCPLEKQLDKKSEKDIMAP